MNEADIFARVIEETDPRRQQQLVDSLCGQDDEMRDRLRQLLAAHAQPETFIDQPVPSLEAGLQPTVEPDVSLERAGTTIGPYKLLQQIGEGGMGLVYMAEQIEPVRRRVALKIIKPGMDSRQIIARFEAERQALAMMDHPNIASVLDAGTTEQGHPYFVMELVNGLPITEYCDRQQMPPVQRLALFADVCRAVQHAHQKGIIHRDLKPSNILIANYDGVPVPKVIDFGVAKATGSQLTEKTLFTEFGHIIGTLEYMSPEQARRNQLDVDTRSDIYSLGIVLYALLTGETPFGRARFHQAAWDEILKIIREDEPPRPSVKLSSSQSLDEVAQHRGTDPQRLSSMVRGDLDWIVMKTLAKDRGRRYATASELADDIGRYLAQQPVLARPPSSLDRLTKFVKRNRGAVLGTSLLLTILAVGGGWLWNQAAREQRKISERTAELRAAMDQARLALNRAEASTIGNSSVWETASARMDRVRTLLDSNRVLHPVDRESEELITLYRDRRQRRDLAEQLESVVVHGATDPSLESWQRMEANLRSFFKQHGFDLDQQPPIEIGQQIREHKYSPLWSDLLELWIGTRGQMAQIGGPRLTAATMQPWAEAIYLADPDPVRTGIRKFIYEGPRTADYLKQSVGEVDLDAHTPRTLSWLANAYLMADDADEADRVFEFALQKYPQDLMLTFDYGYMLESQQRFQEAARMFHRCLALNDRVPGLWISLSKVLEKLGETESAARALSRAEKLKQEIEASH